jgi:hypothetical protein
MARNQTSEGDFNRLDVALLGDIIASSKEPTCELKIEDIKDALMNAPSLPKDYITEETLKSSGGCLDEYCRMHPLPHDAISLYTLYKVPWEWNHQFQWVVFSKDQMKTHYILRQWRYGVWFLGDLSIQTNDVPRLHKFTGYDIGLYIECMLTNKELPSRKKYKENPDEEGIPHRLIFTACHTECY